MRLFFLALLLISLQAKAQHTQAPYLSNETYTYQELIKTYESLDERFEEGRLLEVGQSDIGKPIHVFVIDKSKNFSPEITKQENKAVVFINNGIHSGEACGIDASVELAQSLLDTTSSIHSVLDSVVVVIVPVYNVGGMLNRDPYSRVNQNGPKEHGFRGNAKNLDLNRDFIKADSKNAVTFIKIFRSWDPDFFIDTHTTNGSDHQYTLTLIATQKDKLNPVLSEYMEDRMLPRFYKQMKKKQMEMVPYVYSFGKTPKDGIKAFMETPRYSSGYAALFDCFSFITEAHVYKPFQDRVEQTKGFLETVLYYAKTHKTEIKKKRKLAKEFSRSQKRFALKWKLDKSKVDLLNFKGYETVTRKSSVTGQSMSFYDTTAAYKKRIPYYKTYEAEVIVDKPLFYIIPQAYTRVIERLSWNGVQLTPMNKDTTLEVSTYYILDSKTPNVPYEAHFLHTDIKVEKRLEQHQFFKGDLIIEANQEAIRYILTTLEPESVDGFFAWNFFDGILQQKEWFSDYAFEPKAARLLNENAALKKQFEAKRNTDTTFAADNFAQLYYIYKRSPYYEKSVNRYPVYRVEMEPKTRP